MLFEFVSRKLIKSFRKTSNCLCKCHTIYYNIFKDSLDKTTFISVNINLIWNSLCLNPTRVDLNVRKFVSICQVLWFPLPLQNCMLHIMTQSWLGTKQLDSTWLHSFCMCFAFNRIIPFIFVHRVREWYCLTMLNRN